MIFSGSIHKENIMTITKTQNGTYRLKIYIPIDARMPLGIVNNNYYDKRFKTRKEARQAEIDLLTKLNQIEDNEFTGLGKGEILFSDFFGGIPTNQDKQHLLLNHQVSQLSLILKLVSKDIYCHFLEIIQYSF